MCTHISVTELSPDTEFSVCIMAVPHLVIVDTPGLTLQLPPFCVLSVNSIRAGCVAL